MTAGRKDLPLSQLPSLRQRLPLSLASLLVIGALFFFAYLVLQWRGQTTDTPSALSTTPAMTESALVLSEAAQHNASITIETVQTRTRHNQFEAPGVLTLDETRTAYIGSMVEGRVVTVMAQIGDRVAHSAVLAAIHSHVIHEARAEYRKALAEQRRRETEQQYAIQTEQRIQRLYADKAVSLQEQQRARVDRIAAERALDVAKAEVRRTAEGLEHLGIAVEKDAHGESGEQIPVLSPIAGAVLEKHVTAGTAVTPGMPLFVVSDLTTLWTLAEIDETRLRALTVGQPVTIRVAAYPDKTFPGTVSFIGDMLDPKTRRVTVRCQAPNPDGYLKPQMYATLSFTDSERQDVVVAPSQAVQEFHGKSVVFVAEDGGKFTPREVTLGSEMDGWIEILTGVHPGEKIATRGSFLLKSELSKSAIGNEE